MLGGMFQGRKEAGDESSRCPKHLTQEEAQKLIDMDEVVRKPSTKWSRPASSF